MTAPAEMVIITRDHAAAEQLQPVLSQGPDALVAERRGLDGAVAEWVIFGMATLQSLGGIAAVLHQLLRSQRVSVIKIGDVEVHQPRAADVDDLMRRLQRRLAGAAEVSDAEPEG